MADVYRPHACTEREALERLAAEADAGEDRLSRVRIEFDSSVSRRITLWVPDVVGHSQPPPSAVGLDEGLPRVLVNASVDARRAAEPCDERLLISAGVSEAAVVATLRRLERFATPSRVAKLRSDATVPGGDVWLLHVLVDRDRHSGFAGLEALGLFESWQSLTGYESDGCRLFLTAGVPVARDLLPPLWRLMSNDTAAALLGLAPQGPRDERFFVLSHAVRASVASVGEFDARSPSIEVERIVLPVHAFVDSVEIGFALDASVRVSTLLRDAAAPDLVTQLRERAPSRGYRLMLESTRAVEEAGRDLERLRSQHAYLSQRIAYAESLLRPRPHLLRFNAGQLAALAHTIYSFAPESLFAARPHVRYAYRATPQEPSGLHYLWIDPGAVRRTPDPLSLYESSPPMRFWLDPTWGRHYYDEGSTAGCVFVPEGTALAPPLHAWIPGDMNAHLRRVFGRLSTSAPAPASGDSFIYILDRQHESTEALELTVIERSAFAPIDASVNWINDNIIVAGRLDVADLLRERAAGARADLLEGDAIDAAAATRRDFLRAAAAARERFIKDLDAVISSINRCTFDVLQRAHLAVDAMKRLDDDMDGLADIHDRARGIASVSDLLNDTHGSSLALRDRVSALERDVGEALRQAEAQAADEQRQVEAFIQSLEARRTELRDRLNRN
jgi:hypothetical protein